MAKRVDVTVHVQCSLGNKAEAGIMKSGVSYKLGHMIWAKSGLGIMTSRDSLEPFLPPFGAIMRVIVEPAELYRKNEDNQ